MYHPNEVILTLEYMDCNLRELLRNSGPLSLVLVKSFTHQILQGVAYAKTKRCVHRDLKPANVLVMPRQGIVKLADYGLGRAHDFSGGRYTRQVRMPVSPECTEVYNTLGSDSVAPQSKFTFIVTSSVVLTCLCTLSSHTYIARRK